MRVLVLTSCTGEKASCSPSALRVDDFDDGARLPDREAQLATLHRPAAAMYTGQQHVRAMRGVRTLRSVLGLKDVDVAIVSAGYGLLEENRMIAPYDVTFSGLSPRTIRERGAQLGLPDAVRRLLPRYELVFSLLGSAYLTAVDPPLPIEAGRRVIYFAKPGEKRVAAPGGVLVPAGKPEAQRYGAGLVALKGRMLELVAAAVAKEGPGLLTAMQNDSTPATVLRALDAEVGVR